MVLTIAIAIINSKLQNKNLARFYAGYYVVLAFCYKNLSRTSFTFINCKTINNQGFLFINGEIDCYTKWQKNAIFIFLALWVAPFPVAVALGYRMLKNNKIPMWFFVLYLTFPAFSILMTYCIKNKKRDTVHLMHETSNRLFEILEAPYKNGYYWLQST